MSDTPRTDVYPCKLVERTINEALFPRGMSTHDGKVTLPCDHVQHIIAVSRALELDLARVTAELEACREDANNFHNVMQCLRWMKMEHGLCEPRERRACTHCNAEYDLNEMLKQYKGPKIVLHAARGKK